MSNTMNSHPESSGSMSSLKAGSQQLLREGADRVSEGARDATEHFVTEPAKDLFSLAKDYAREKPDVAAAWAFGLGVIVGWKIKPW